MKPELFTVPNFLSASRIPLTLAFGYCRWAGLGTWAFWLLALAMFTDMIDGYVARRLNAESAIGKKYIDPFCDAFMTIGAGFCLTLGPTARPWAGPVGIGLVILTCAMKILKHDSPWEPLQRFCNLALPLLYIFTVTAIAALYATDLREDDTWIIPTAILGLVIARILKHQRLKDWISGRM